MSDVLGVIVQLSGLVFVVSSMLAMDLSLTVPEIIAPLKLETLARWRVAERLDPLRQGLRRCHLPLRCSVALCCDMCISGAALSLVS